MVPDYEAQCFRLEDWDRVALILGGYEASYAYLWPFSDAPRLLNAVLVAREDIQTHHRVTREAIEAVEPWTNVHQNFEDELDRRLDAMVEQVLPLVPEDMVAGSLEAYLRAQCD